MTDANPKPLVRSGSDVEYEPVELADGLRKGVLLGDDQGTPHFDMRRFVLEPGAEVPRHTNEVEHEQFVIGGEYAVGLGDEIHTVSAGDSILVPAGVEHWYRNDSERQGSFLCVVPKADDRIELIE